MAVNINGYLDNQGSDTGFFLPGSTTDDTSPLLQGTLTSFNPSDSVFILRDGIILGFASVTAMPGGGATWSYQDSGLADGHTYNYTALVFNAATLTMEPSNPCAITVSTGGVPVSPPLPLTITIDSVIDDKGPATGPILNNGTTDDDTPTLRGTLSDPLEAGQSVHVFRGSVDVGTATVDPGNNWQFTDTGLANGNYSYTAKVMDGGIPVTESSPYAITVAPDPAAGPVTTTVTLKVWDDVAPVTGWVIDGETTNDDTPTLQGTLSAPLAAGQSVHVFRSIEGGVNEDWGVASVTGTDWTFNDFGLVSGNHYTYTARVVSAGSDGPVSNSVTFLFDPIGHTPSLQIREIINNDSLVTSSIPNHGLSNDSTPLLKGTYGVTLNPGDHFVVVRDGVTELPVLTVDTNAKTWEYQESVLSDGDHTYVVRIVDAGGAEVLTSDQWTIKVDTTPPPGTVTIVNYTDDQGPLTGNFISGTTTDDKTPKLNGTVTGLESGDTVAVYQGTTLLGTASVSATGGNGTWSYQITSDLADGSYTYTAKVVDAAGNPGTPSNDFSLTVYTQPIPPNVLTITAIEDDTGVSATDFITHDNTLLFHGTLQNALTANEKVQVSLDGVHWNDAATSGTSWTWDNSANAIPEGSYTIEARVVNIVGAVGATDNHALMVDTTPPPGTVSIDTYTDDVGLLTGDFISGTTTDDTQPKLNGTVTGLESGDTVAVYQGTTLLGTASVSATGGNGTWSYQITSDLAPDGAYTFTAKVVDLAGNTGTPSDDFSLTVYTQPIPPNVITIAAIEDDTGISATDFITKDDTLLFHGTLQNALTANEKVQVSLDGVHWNDAATSGTSWTWDNSANAIPEGSYTIEARVVNIVGAVGATDNHALVVDTTPPPGTVSIDTYTDDVGFLTGDFISGTATDDTQPKLNGTITGLESGDTIAVYQGTTLLGTASVSATGGNGTWSYQITSNLADGDHTFTAKVVDLAGNTGTPSSPFNFTVDTTSPPGTVTIVNFTDDVGPLTGDFLSGTTTDDAQPKLNGTVTGLESGDTVAVYQGTTLLGTASVSATGGNGTWSYQITSNLADGDHTFTAKVLDSAGNPGIVSNTFSLTVDTVSVTTTAAITGIMDDVTPVTGLMTHSGDPTNDSTPELRGTLSAALTAGQDLLIFRDNVWIGNVGTFTGLDWAFTDDSGGMTNGQTYKYTAQVVNNAGVPGTPSAEYLMKLDLGGQVKINPIAGNDVLDATEAAGSVTISGTLENIPSSAAASSVQVVVNVGGTNYNATVAGTSWSVTVAGSALNSAATGGQGHVGATLTFVDDMNTAATVTASRGYLLHIEQQPVHTYTVDTPYAGLGYAMTAINDFNGDGYTDYIVSAPGAHYGNLLAAGKSVMYLLYGSANGLPNVSNLDSITAAQGIRITCSNTCGGGVGLQGMTVSDIGDFNGDGRNDVAISSNLNNATYVLYGQAGNAIQTVDLNKLTAAQGFSVKAACWAPASVTGGDINGDGYGDLIVSNLDCGGKAYVIYGHAGTQGNITYTGSTVKGAAAGYTTESGSNGLGTVLNAVGDVNGDGYTDFVATMPGNASAGGKTPGSAYLVFGGPNGVSQPGTTQVNLDKIGSGQVVTISASNYFEHLGGQAGCGGNTLNADAYKAEFHSVTGLGMIDGSGHSAFAIGSPGASPSDSKSTTAYTCGSVSEGAGAVYVLYDQTNWSNITLPSWNSVTKNWSGGSLNGSNGFVIYSSSFANLANGKLAGASDLGFAVSSAGDVNGDGFSDFLIGAPAAYGGKGAVYVVFGAAGGLPGANTGVVDLDALVAAGKTGAFGQAGTAIEYIGTTTIAQQSKGGSNMGTDVTGGDFNGTGIHGYSFSAWGQSNGTKIQTGETYVYDGIATLLTQPISNANGAVYYAGNGVDKIATGSGNNVWVHGVGVDDTPGPFSTTVQHDAVSGGAGSDYIGIVSTNFTSINGGNGTDTLVFEGSNIKLNLAQMGLRVQGMEQFDLNNQTHTAAGDPQALFDGQTTNNTLELRLSDVLNQMSDAPNSQRMTILGDNTSTVNLIGANWSSNGSQTVAGVSYDVWHNTAQGSNTVADLLIQHGVNVMHI